MRSAFFFFLCVLMAGCITAPPADSVPKGPAVTEESILGKWAGLDTAGKSAYAVEFSPNKRGKLAIVEGEGALIVHSLAWSLSGRRVTCAAKPQADVVVDAFGPIMTLRVKVGASGPERQVDLYRADEVLPRLERAVGALGQ